MRECASVAAADFVSLLARLHSPSSLTAALSSSSLLSLSIIFTFHRSQAQSARAAFRSHPQGGVVLSAA